MNFKEKRHAKKMANLFITLAYVVMTAWMVVCVYGILSALLSSSEPNWSNLPNIVILAIGIVPLMVCLILSGIGQGYITKRVFYKKAISEYRQCSFFTQSIRLVMMGDEKSISKAVKLYDMIHENSARRGFLFSYMITSNYYSFDKERHEKGKQRLNKVLDDFNPETVKFKK